MHAKILSGFSIFLLISSPVFASKNPLEEVRKNFQGKNGFEAQFTQHLEEDVFLKKDKAGKKESGSRLSQMEKPNPVSTEATGELKFKRPHSLVWTYEKPKHRVIRYDGEKLTTEEGGDKQIIYSSSEINLQETFAFLWGETKKSNFEIEILDVSHFRIRPKITKKDEAPPFQFIDVGVEKGFVTEAKVQNALQGKSVLTFSHWKLLK